MLVLVSPSANSSATRTDWGERRGRRSGGRPLAWAARPILKASPFIGNRQGVIAPHRRGQAARVARGPEHQWLAAQSRIDGQKMITHNSMNAIVHIA
jgi:hypothetical protein